MSHNIKGVEESQTGKGSVWATTLPPLLLLLPLTVNNTTSDPATCSLVLLLMQMVHTHLISPACCPVCYSQSCLVRLLDNPLQRN